MPTVLISGSACHRFTGGKTELEVDATTFRRLVIELEERFPGLGKQVEDSMAVAIDPTKGYLPASGMTSSNVAPPPGGMVHVCMPCMTFAGLPSTYTLSKSAPMTWNAEKIVGPAFMTCSRMRSPGAAGSGSCWYWFAAPLNTTKSGVTACMRAMSPSQLPSLPFDKYISLWTSTYSFAGANGSAGSTTIAPSEVANQCRPSRLLQAPGW